MDAVTTLFVPVFRFLGTTVTSVTGQDIRHGAGLGVLVAVGVPHGGVDDRVQQVPDLRRVLLMMIESRLPSKSTCSHDEKEFPPASRTPFLLFARFPACQQPALPRWHRESRDAPHYACKEPPRQVAFGQQQPLVPRVSPTHRVGANIDVQSIDSPRRLG